MKSVRRNARVRYTAQQMFDLVNDVESYPRFLHWCRGASADRRGGATIEASLDIGFKGIHKTFRTLNKLDPPHRIDIELVSGPFRRLDGHWAFEDLEQGCEVRLELDFDVKAGPLSFMFSAVFEEIARHQMNAFIARARDVYD